MDHLNIPIRGHLLRSCSDLLLLLRLMKITMKMMMTVNGRKRRKKRKISVEALYRSVSQRFVTQ